MLGKNSPNYAYFSQQQHEADAGLHTFELRDPSGATVRANYMGGEIDGYPGYVEDGKVIRPQHFETFVRVGEVGPGKLVLVESPEQTRRWLGLWRPGPLCTDLEPQ